MAERQRQIIIPPPVPGTQEYYIQERLNRDLLPYEKQLGMVRDNSYRYEYKADNNRAIKYGSWIYLFAIFFLGLCLSCSYLPEPTKPIVLNLSFGVETDNTEEIAIDIVDSFIGETDLEEPPENDNVENEVALADPTPPESSQKPLEPEPEPQQPTNTYQDYLDSISALDTQQSSSDAQSTSQSSTTSNFTSLTEGINNAIGYNNQSAGPFGRGGNSMDSLLAKAGAQTGEIQISLLWNTYDDIDLHVSYGQGNGGMMENINWTNRRGQFSGGYLDVDMNAGGPQNNPGVENIFWPYGLTPHGYFIVKVQFYHSWTGNRTVPVLVRIKKGTSVQTFNINAFLGVQPQIVARFQY